MKLVYIGLIAAFSVSASATSLEFPVKGAAYVERGVDGSITLGGKEAMMIYRSMAVDPQPVTGSSGDLQKSASDTTLCVKRVSPSSPDSYYCVLRFALRKEK